MRWHDFPTIKLLIEAAKELKIKSQLLGKLGFLKVRRGKAFDFIYRTKTPLNNQVAVFLSESKYLSSKILQKEGLPTQNYYLCLTPTLALKTARKLGFPLVVKPNVGSRGKGVTADINSDRELQKAIKLAFDCHEKIVISPYFPGEDYRLLVLKDQVIGAIKREPPKITGDGQKSIQELIELENQKRRELNQKRIVPLKMIEINDEVQRQLKNHQLLPDSALGPGEVLVLRRNANWSSGGTATTVKIKNFHPKILQTTIQASQLLTLGLAGVDLILKDLKRPLKGNGIILEVNANPAIGVFHQPVSGPPQKVAPKILHAILFH